MHPGVHARQAPDKAACVMATGDGEVLTYRDLEDRSVRLARLLAARGLRRGDVIAILMENNPRYFEPCWAAQRSGLYYTAISSRLTPAEVSYILQDCGARALVVSSDKAAVAAEALARGTAVEHRLLVGRPAEEVDGFEDYDAALAEHPPDPLDEEVEGSDMLYSSGTTGRPKGVRWPLPTRPFGTPPPLMLVAQGLYGFGPDMVYLSPGPLYHAAPLRFCMVAHRVGATVVLMDRFDAAELLAVVERHRVTHTQVVPTMFVRLLKLPEDERARHDLSSLQVVIHAAAPCPVPVKEQMMRWWGPIIHEYYAGTEGNGFCAIGPQEWLAHKGSVGRTLLGEVHVVGDDGNEKPPYEPGTVYFARGTPFEYHNDPEQTQASYNDKGWSTLGDVGYVDEEGYLYLTDRRADMIISGGVNVYPQETENVLTVHPKVADAAVFGVPNEDLGEEVKAVVQPVDMAEAGPGLERELIAFCRSRLASVKCPRSVDFAPELPRQPTGKLHKRLLKARYWPRPPT